MKKKISIITIIPLILALFSSCDNTEANPENSTINTSSEVKFVKSEFTAENDNYKYEIDGNILFTVSDKGKVYYINIDQLEKSVVLLDLSGQKTGEYKINDENGSISGISVINDNIYFSFSPYKHNTAEASSNIEIYGLDTKTGSQEKLVVIEGFSEVSKMITSGNKLYVLGRDNTLESGMEITENYSYNGETVKSIDVSTKQIESVIPTGEMPLMLSETADGGAIIYAFDESGFYFRNLISNVKTINNNSGLLHNFDTQSYSDFEAYDDTNIIYIGNRYLYLSPIDDSAKPRELVETALNANKKNSFISKGGYIFVKKDYGINRIQVNELLKGSTELNLAYTNPYNDKAPSPSLYKSGFKVKSEAVPYYDFAMSLLSGDSVYDMYYLNSWYDISDNIKRKGAFYSLNDVPFVKEYIEACFPYVKYATYDDNGNVWMVPIHLEASAINYNELLCTEYGIEPTTIKSLEELADVLTSLRNIKLNYYLDISHEVFFERYFYQIMNKNNGFNRDDFKKMAEYFYTNINYVKTNWSFNRYLGNGVDPDTMVIKDGANTYLDFRGKTFFDDAYVPHYADVIETALSCEDFNEEEFWEKLKKLSPKTTELNYKHNRYTLCPPIEGTTESDVTIEFIAVNPNSKNLDVTLEYISKLCEYQLSLENSFILKDKSTYSDRHFINDMYDVLSYEGNFIRFSLDSEIIYSDFEKYLGDEISLDKYLKNIEFKLNAYLKE